MGEELDYSPATLREHLRTLITHGLVERLLGGQGAVLLTLAVVAWTVVPLRLAGRRFAQRDL